jgi:SAM-dependent methyltransferase
MPEDNPKQLWARRLFAKSVLKQEKYRQISRLLPELTGRLCLDIGADNGVISMLLREKGGTWASADLDPLTVESIRELVQSDVHQITGERTPFSDQEFDLVVIVDFLEHIPDDAAFVRELRRILKPGGQVIINVPRLVKISLLKQVQNALGLTDEKHGHLRPGYSREGLERLLAPHFQVTGARAYSRTFSESIDTVLNFLYETLQKRKQRSRQSAKGRVVTSDDMSHLAKEFKLMSLMYPALWFVSKLDALLVGQKGYKLVIRADMVQ